MERNIEVALDMVPLDRFRPHVKTNKTSEICKILIEKGVNKFKTSTIAETEMIAMLGGKDVLLAHQLTSVKMDRFIKLKFEYPKTFFSCIFDDFDNLAHFNELLKYHDIKQDVFIDVNVGMNRTGVNCNELIELYQQSLGLDNINIRGFHIYDGHIRESNVEQREVIVKDTFQLAYSKIEQIENSISKKFEIVAGGSPSFSVHAQNKRVECSPGTFIFWDWKYSRFFPDLKFECAVYIITRVISVLDGKRICLDVGHKAVSAENPFPRLKFLHLEEVKSLLQSEEHLVIEIEDTSKIKVGDVFLAIPDHICPTVALHECMHVIENNKYVFDWQIVARKRKINL
ncbi:alanine racemase [Flavobacterium oreochromis]